LIVAIVVVLAELAVITWICHRSMDTSAVPAAMEFAVGGGLVFCDRDVGRKFVNRRTLKKF